MAKDKIKNGKKISNLLLRNYIVSSLIMFFTFTIFFGIILSLWIIFYLPINNLMSEEESKILAENIIKDDYSSINADEIIKIKGWIEVVDKDFNIIYSKGTMEKKKTAYKKDEFYKMILGSSDGLFQKNHHICNIAYNSNKDFFLVVYLPNDNYFTSVIRKNRINVHTFFKISVLCYIIIFIIIMCIYAKITSRNITVPLEKLMDGVNNITEGDYTTRIKLKAKNEFGKLSDAFNLMTRRLEKETKLKEQSEEARRRLIMDISHDLKNPLASIRGYSDFLIKNLDLSDKEKIKYLSIIENNSIRVNDLITDLFELSKFESLDFTIDFQRVDICEFLREIIAEYIPSMEDKNIEYYFEIPEESIYTYIDEKSMYRALSNIIVNSIKYNGDGTNIKIILVSLEDTIQLVIEDDGIGIPKELNQCIFDPFVRVDTSRNSKSGGTGLGLAITKSIVEKHNGVINLISDREMGCKFIITLNKEHEKNHD